MKPLGNENSPGHRIFVLGTPRSGTSMVAGLFNRAGYYSGEKLLKPTVSNPDGYFECQGINDINNTLVGQMLEWPMLNRLRWKISGINNLDRRAYAFASPSAIKPVTVLPAMQKEMMAYLNHSRFCLKDPRFCVTLHEWRRLLGSPSKVVVVFREPGKTVESYKRNGKTVYDPPLLFRDSSLYHAYARNYRRLLSWADTDWMFVHYDQVLRGDSIVGLQELAGCELFSGHLNPDLRRSSGADALQPTRGSMEIYEALCARAGYGTR